MMYYDTFDTPDGDFTVIVSDQEVIAAGWTTDIADLLTRVSAAPEPENVQRSQSKVAFAKTAVAAYYSGQLDAIDAVQVRQDATPFKKQVWQQLRQINPGRTLTYSELAQRAGNAGAVRAAANACATNPVALFVPCHRVVAKSGGLASFLYGMAIKKSLLAREQTQL